MENLSKILPSIGAMDEPITVQTYTVSRDAAGGEVLAWSDYVTTLARVQWPEAGLKEVYSAGQQTAFRRVVFWLRYDLNLHNAKMRILYGPEVCDVLGARIEGRNRYSVLTCQMREESIGLTNDAGQYLTDTAGEILTQ